MVSTKQDDVNNTTGEQCCLQEELCIGHRCELPPPDDQMGNGSSQSIVLGPPRPLGIPLRDSRFRKGPAKYAHPQNRVLPKPVLGQRLRSTDNGNILHSAGTIRGQKPGSGLHNNEDGNADPEMMGILRRRSEMIERENCYHQLNLRNHRLFHSDPDIACSRPTLYSPEALDPGGQRRSGGGVAMRASRLRYRKKARAPDPPNASSLPRQFERRSQQTSTEIIQNKNAQCRCVDSSVEWRPKTRAPPPPAKVVSSPPPPPPLPGVAITRTTESSLTRIQGYEKNMHPLDKWRISRSVGDIRNDDEEEDSRSGSRTTVFDSKANITNGQGKKPSFVSNQPDPFQKEIEAVTRKIAESRQQDPGASTEKKELEVGSQPTKNSPKQYYFSDAAVVKPSCNGSINQNGDYTSHSEDNNSRREGKTGNQERSNADAMINSFETSESRFGQRYFIESTPLQEKQMVNRLNEINNQYKQMGKREGTDVDGGMKFNSRFRERIPLVDQRRNEEWEEIHRRLSKTQEEDETDIDIRLRPVLPRKTLEIPEFSPSEMWQALGPDIVSGSNPSTSEGDDALESVSRRYNKPIPPKRSKKVEGTRQLDDSHHQKTKDQLLTNKTKGKVKNDTHWTPRQDLADDSDGSSIDSEDAVVPRNQMSQAEIPTRFSLPTVMFSNMRPIGSELPAIKTVNNNDPSYLEDNVTRTRSRKKRVKNGDSSVDVNTLSNLKRFLGIRSKYLSEEDITAVDSNWTFGEYELQKKGRHYASDLMLADKRKYELLVRNNLGELLGDILVTKANDVRNKLKSSNSDNSNFSFYSTEGHVVYLPEAEQGGGMIRGKNCGRSSEEVSPLTKGRVYNTRKKLDGGCGKGEGEAPTKGNNNKKKFDFAERELDRKRGLELMRVLEDEVRRRRNKEKISIRQQLQMIKRQNSEDEDEDDFDDEAYFTEPKSRDGTQSPQYHQGHLYNGSYRTNVDSSPLTHWKSSPALLEDPSQKGVRHFKDDHSSSSITSSPDLLDPETWQRPGVVDRWLQRQQPLKHQVIEKYRKGGGRLPEHEMQEAERSSSDDYRYPTVEDDIPGKGSKSGNHGHPPQHKERRKTNIYKQLMDIVRREERQMNRAEGQDDEPTSRESSYSQRESSRSSSSSPSSESSYSYSDSIDQTLFESSAQSGIPANNEFHTSLDLKPSEYRMSGQNGGRLPLVNAKNDLPKPSFQVAFVQPFSPNKGYRPVPFEVVVPSATGCRRSGLQDAPHQVQGPVS